MVVPDLVVTEFETRLPVVGARGDMDGDFRLGTVPADLGVRPGATAGQPVPGLARDRCAFGAPHLQILDGDDGAVE